MEFLDSDINVDVIGFGALNVDKLHTVENIHVRMRKVSLNLKKILLGDLQQIL